MSSRLESSYFKYSFDAATFTCAVEVSPLILHICSIHIPPSTCPLDSNDLGAMAKGSSRLIVIYCSSHGLGHLTRCLEVARVVKGMGHSVTIVTSMKNCEKLGGTRVSSSLHDGNYLYTIRDAVLDSGAVQKDVFSVDISKTLESYRKIHEVARNLYIQERDWLLEIGANVVVSDVVPIAFRAAEMANIPSICLSNFTWDFIYKSFGDEATQSYAEMISCIEEDCSRASLFLRLPGSCPCIDKLGHLAIDIPMVVRVHRQSPSSIREIMDVPPEAKLCLVMLGGHELGIDDFSLNDLLLPEGWICFVTPSVLNGEKSTDIKENFRVISQNAYLPDYVLCVNVVVGKIGYGAVSECVAHKTPLVYVRRNNFAEEPNLVALLTSHGAGFEISVGKFLSKNWCSFLTRANSLEPKDSAIDGSIIASQIINDIVDIHETLKEKNMPIQMMHEYFRNGSLSYWAFVKQLLYCTNGDMSVNREEVIHISKAPGRLDVMGGIADYSGSFALEMPLSAGTFVATQISSFKSRFHDGAKNSVLINLYSPTPKDTDRTSFISINLSDILFIEPDGSTRAKDFNLVKAFLTRNPPDRWAAYVIGVFPILAATQRLMIPTHINTITIVIGSTGLNEGAGVSSSASLEVASVLSIAEALNVRLEDGEAPLIAQMVENRIVGACCGIMDQLSSYLGHKNKLICLKCTDPFHIEGLVQIPSNIKFWGIDSGLRRSTSSSAYTSCRVAAFMGKKIINSLELARVDYLADLKPKIFENTCLQFLPVSITGAQFLDTYGSHEDSSTEVDPAQIYLVKASTSHPVLENQRIISFRDILQACNGELGLRECKMLGELMYDSHESYSRCGLGSPETDILVRLCKETEGVFGAKITGGGGGGTVCLVTLNDHQGKEAVKAIQQQYDSKTGLSSTLFHGSSAGAENFGVARLKLGKL